MSAAPHSAAITVTGSSKVIDVIKWTYLFLITYLIKLRLNNQMRSAALLIPVNEVDVPDEEPFVK